MTDQQNLSFEQTLEHYIVLEKKNKRKDAIIMGIGAVVLDISFILTLIVPGAEPFMIGVLGVFGGLLSWLTFDAWKKNDPKTPATQSPIYNFLVSQSGNIVELREMVVFGGGGRAKLTFKLPWQNSIESDESRAAFISKYKNFHSAKSTFIFIDNNRKEKQLEIPANEAPIFAKMLQAKMPQAKFGYNEMSKSVSTGNSAVSMNLNADKDKH